ncbi:MAG: FkbM family methyltransferase [Potamolinea sp.]
MQSSLSSADSYFKYLESACLNLNSDVLSRVTKCLEDTSWDNPTSAIELNNIAVVALIEAETCQDLSIRSLYLEMALEALKTGVEELPSHPLCAAHLALVYAMTGEMNQGMQIAFSTLIDTLQLADRNNQQILPGIVYLPPSNSFTDTRYENLAKILQTEDGYAQSLLLLSEVLCRSQLVFYNATGLRFLHLANQLLGHSPTRNLKLGISSIINNQWEGLIYLHRAREMAPDSAKIIQALYLAYRDLEQMETAKLWLDIARDFTKKNTHSLDWEWTKLEANSPITYVAVENQLLLTVEPSLRSLVSSVLIAEGDWFEKEMEFWRSWIKPGMTVIDVGANVGVYTFSAAKLVGENGCVLAVEPFSGCVRCLQETCRTNQLSWVKVCAGAASDRNGTVQLALHTASEINEVVSSNVAATMKPGTFEEVTCFTLDTLIEQENVSQVDFLKIDAEGHELQVLEGSNQLLAKFSPTILYENIAGSKGSNLAVVNFLIAREYQLFQYQPYLQQLIPINSTQELAGKLNIIALPNTKASALGYKIDSFQTEAAKQTNTPSVYSPIDVFHSTHYQRHNQRRQEHLASLDLDLANATVLEVGAGIGDHTSFFLDRGCQVVSTEARQDNLQILRYRYPNLQVRHLDLDNPDPNFNEVFDIVYCYGLLYHLQKPVEAIEFMSRCCQKMLLLETCVSFGEEELINPCLEMAESPSQAISGQGCRPTRKWVYKQLKQHFDFVYMPITQPNHEEFPLDWSLSPSTKILTRSVYIASRQPLDNPILIEDIPVKQKRH